MDEQLQLVCDVADRLAEAGIDYMITGSIASAIYAVPRMTRDIDVVIHVSPVEGEKLIAVFKEDYYLDEETLLQAIRRHEMFNVIDQKTVIKIDFIIRKNDEYRRVEFDRRRQIAIDGHLIWVVAPEDLILSKLLWVKESESELQFRDVKQLLATVKGMDTDYLRDWAARLDVAGIFEKAKPHE
ncbi:MAG: nucleotidyl transferase AbiEii/AbiGii toxin family protein [Armatimonadota bacterium]